VSRAKEYILLGLLTFAAVAFMFAGFSIAHQQRIIADQRQYIELGCHGRYQGD
jgi:hypothetical protein